MKTTDVTSLLNSKKQLSAWYYCCVHKLIVFVRKTYWDSCHCVSDKSDEELKNVLAQYDISEEYENVFYSLEIEKKIQKLKKDSRFIKNEEFDRFVKARLLKNPKRV